MRDQTGCALHCRLRECLPGQAFEGKSNNRGLPRELVIVGAEAAPDPFPWKPAAYPCVMVTF